MYAIRSYYAPVIPILFAIKVLGPYFEPGISPYDENIEL